MSERNNLVVYGNRKFIKQILNTIKNTIGDDTVVSVSETGFDLREITNNDEVFNTN